MVEDTTSTEIVRTDGETVVEQTTTTTKAKSFVLARIKPFNPRAGLTVRSYTYKGYRFREEMGWYRIPAELGEELKSIAVVETDPYSPFLFDVLGEEEAQKLDDLEQKRRDRALASRPNQAPDLRRSNTRRLSTAREAVEYGTTGVVTTAALRAPNDEAIPNGYPPPRVYPMPQPGGVPQVNAVATAAIETDIDEEEIEAAKQAGVDDKTLGLTAANLTRDMNGGPPLVDGQGQDDEEIDRSGSTDFGSDNTDPSAPATPPSARRRRRGG